MKITRRKKVKDEEGKLSHDGRKREVIMYVLGLDTHE